jgi:DNA-binding transcriptional LysR family regulator
MDLNQIAVFVQVVEAGSFTAAARRLEMPKSTVSRKVAELEERLGARLIHRTTRRLGLTDAGGVYFEHARRMVSEMEEAEQAVGRLEAEPRGLLRVTAPLSFSMLGPIVAEYLRRYRDVQIELVCTDRRIDLVEERFDLAVRAGALADSSLVARSLGGIRQVLVAAPSYCKQAGTPKTPADLKRHACLAFPTSATPDVWILEAGGKQTQVRITPRALVNDLETLRSVVQAGVGIAWMPLFVVADDIKRDRLRRVLPDWGSAEAPLHAVYPSARHLSPKVVAFVELVRERLDLS